MQTRQVLVIGGAGWIGSAICSELVRNPELKVLGAHRRTPLREALIAAGVQAVPLDLVDLERVRIQCRSAHTVIYAASAGGESGLRALRTVAEELQSSQTLIYISGSSIYGETPDGAAREDEAPNARSPEWLADMERSALGLPESRAGRRVILRAAAILHGDGGGATPRFLVERALETQSAEYLNDGGQRWSCGHVADLAAFAARTTVDSGIQGVFNVADETVELGAVASALAERLELRLGAVSIDRSTALDRWGPGWAQMLSGSLEIDTRAARSVGWAPAHPRFLDELRRKGRGIVANP